MAGKSENIHIVAVHGTFSGKEYIEDIRHSETEFYSRKSDFSGALLAELPDARWHEFTWSGKNLESARKKGARELKKYLRGLSLPPEDRVVVISHSHGGNVALDSLRKAPIDNPVSLFTVGTPFIWHEPRRLLGKLGVVLPNMVFFLACIFIALIIGFGNLRYIGYGVPFMEMPTGTTVTRFFDSFNQQYAIPVAASIIVAASVWLIILPLLRLMGSRRFDYVSPQKFHLRRVWRTDDEAIGMLSTNAKISFPISIFTNFIRGVCAFTFIVYAMLSASSGYRDLMKFRREQDAEQGWDYVLLFSAEVAGLGICVVLVLMILNFLIQAIFRVPLAWLISAPINSVLRKTSKGEDGYQKLSVSSKPEIPDKFVESFNEHHDKIAPVLEEVKDRSDQYMLEHRADIMRTLTMGDGYLTEVLGKSDLALSLIHCNYFTPAMARFMADTIKSDMKA